MSGLSYDAQMHWRLELERLVRQKADSAGTPHYLTFVHPPHYYRYGDGLHKTEREAMQWDLSQIRDSDIVVVDLNTVSDSIGTCMELGFIEAINQMGAKHIHVVGIGQPVIDHPWLHEIPLRIETTVEDAATYIAAYLLV